MPLRIHLVAHTHWDREWYQPFVRFRQRLASLVDELLDDPPPPGESFLLDGQAVVLEDYLGVRPGRTPELAALLREGRLEAGPWYVLADELIPRAESLIRNLLCGRRAVRVLGGAPPPVLYCPDAFGHPAGLPTIAAGFGLPLIILWRGYGGRRWPPGDTVRWRAPDGTTVLVYHLPPDGYEYGSHLPADPAAAAQRWSSMRELFASRSRSGVVMLQNGADHHARQLDQRAAFAALADAAAITGDRACGSSLATFTRHLLERTDATRLPVIEGELRDSYGYTWTLQGTFGTRAAQKRLNARAERSLVRDAEPWAALARARGAPSRNDLLRAAWRTLLQAHPHDTLCGCSIDAVARAMEQRLDDALVQAQGIRDDSIADVVGYESAAAPGARERWHPAVIVRNRAARPREGVALVATKQFVADVPVGPGSAPTESTPKSPARLPVLSGGSRLQLLRRHDAYDRIESPRHYPDNDLVTVSDVAVWVPTIAGYGTCALPIGPRRGRVLDIPNPVRVERHALDNGQVRVEVADDGTVTAEHRSSGRRIESLVALEDMIDLGDSYTASLRGPASVARFAGATLLHRGPLIAEIETRWRLAATGAAASDRIVGHLNVRLSLRANQPVIHLRVDGRNLANDHRLRFGVRTDIVRGACWADATFGPVHRTPLAVPDEDSRMEMPPATAPLHRYVSLFADDRGTTLFSDGLAEYEATDDGTLFVTLLRATGELSRNDLPERPGHAGWPARTPGGQSHGSFEAQFAYLLHGPRSPAVIDEIERTADDVLLPLEGDTLRAALQVPPPTSGVELLGEGLAFSTFKDAEDGTAFVARCVNLLDREVEGAWRFGFPVYDAELARLDETPLAPLELGEGIVRFRAAARAVVTVLLR